MADDGVPDEVAALDDTTVSNSIQGDVGYSVQIGSANTVNIYGGRPEAAPSPPRYLDLLVAEVTRVFDGRVSFGPVVITGPDAVLAVTAWAASYKGGRYQHRTKVVDIRDPYWHFRLSLSPGEELVVIRYVTDYAQVEAFWAANMSTSDIPIVVATPHELAECWWATPVGEHRGVSFHLLPSETEYRLYPFEWALGIGFLAGLVVVIGCLIASFPWLAVVSLAVVAAGGGGFAGHRLGLRRRAPNRPNGGTLTITPDGIQRTGVGGVFEAHWADVESLVDVEHVLRLNYRAAELGSDDVCVIESDVPYSDVPAVEESYAQLCKAVYYWWLPTEGDRG